MPDDITPHRFRVPREDRSLLTIPQLEVVPRLVEQNRETFAETRCSLHGRSLSHLREAARREALAAARSFTSFLLQIDLPETESQSVVVGGHQPELFHVGVWAKNFTLSGVARQTESAAVNLIIDNDTLNSTSLRIPTGSRDSLRIDRFLFDAPRQTQPWEEATILDKETFQKFGQLVEEHIRKTWGFDPLIGSAWKAAVRQSELSNRLCDGLTAMRVHVERAWGQNNLELPMSKLCETEPFLWFAAHLLMRLPELHAIYNETVAEYRSAHRLRNRMQPVPDLTSEEGWLEAPFWVWRRNESQRNRLFTRRVGAFCELRDEKDIFARLPLNDNSDLKSAVSELQGLPSRGIRLRTRALTTTLFARVCLADLFVHGIGGAKYDAMTDQLCERLFGLKAPGFLTVSGTLYLPLGNAYSATDSQLRDIDHQIRDLDYNPDRHLGNHAEAKPLIDEKAELLATARLLRESRQIQGRLGPDQHRRLGQIRTELKAFTGELRAEYHSTRAKLRAQLATNSLIRNREYSFALYPEEQVRQFLMPLSEDSINTVGS